ncbi:MAG: hypothetical protein LBL24_08520 [Bacteroidales bacterium]|jgi:hypothetical protein|nr:hypothetical protein [Bacteroidales bacterium]
MFKTNALILLVNSLTKAEKKRFKSYSRESGYITLFDIIDKNKTITPEALRAEYLGKKAGASFDITINYLYQLLLDSLLALRKEQDHHYLLLNKLLKSRILFEKSLFEEALEMLDQVKEAAWKYENQYILIYAARMELDYLLSLNFPNISETDLLNRYSRINEAIKMLRIATEQSALFDLLKHRMIHKGNIRSKAQVNALNDLVVSEMSIVASSGAENFEIKKQHQLFQSNYLIYTGDYNSALRSYHELNRLFEDNRQLWTNPPIYYVQVVEGILDNLRSIRKYDELPYFTGQLKKIHHSSKSFQAGINALVFLYELFPLLDQGDFPASLKLLNLHQNDVLDRLHLLNPARQAEVCLYTALVYFGNNDFRKTQKALQQIIIRGKSFYFLPLYRTIRLVNLMTHYETGDFDMIQYESRSIKREISRNEKIYRTEHLMLRFVGKPLQPGQKAKMWEKLSPELDGIRNDIFETHILKIFDFTAWIESKLRRSALKRSPTPQVGREAGAHQQ